MYILIYIFLAICVFFFIIHFYRRKFIIRKICCMDFCEKLELLNTLAEPLGFSYLPAEDIMSTRLDGWQKDFGYCRLYDKSAPNFNMVFDCEPVYFDYDNRTWLIEMWKGQYGINVGSEIGIYQADTILATEQYEHTLFSAVSDDNLFPILMTLNFKGVPLFSSCQNHWWLTGFRTGMYCEPEDLVMDVSITFPCEDMLSCFVESLKRIGYNMCELYICGLTVSFSFSTPHTSQPRFHRFGIRISRFENRLFCKLYNIITRPFNCTMDKILYLYFFLPVLFRRLLCFRRNRRQKPPRRNRNRK